MDLREVLRRVWDRRVAVIAATLVAAVLGVVLATVLPKWYKSTAVILPPDDTDLASNLGIMGRALSKFPALGQFGEYTTPADIYKAILLSRTVLGEVADRYDLGAVYHLKSREKTLKSLASHSSVKMNQDGTLTVTVEDRDPKRSAGMNMAMLQALDHYNITKRNTLGHRTRVFLEQRLAETDSALKTSEAALKHYQESHKMVAPIAPSAAGDISSAADLMARKVTLEVRLGVLRGYLREDNEQIVQVRRELAELERQLGTMPAMQTEFARLVRDNKVQEQLFVVVSAEYEDARMQEVRDTPTIAILDPPVVPEHHSRPRRSLFAAVAGLLGLIGASVVVSRREPVPAKG